MPLPALQAHLQSTFFAPAGVGLEAVIRLAIGEESLVFEISDGTITFDPTGSLSPDATFFFEDVDTAWALLSGQANAIDAFMAGRFRADGYLMWAFRLMAMFQSSSLPETPTE